MTLLSPLSLLWLSSVAVLVWLWRITSSRRQVRVSSLVPFEHLLRRPLRSRARLFVNVLFWLQLAALIGLALALARPVVFGRPTRRLLAVLDTSASMGAQGHAAFERGRAALMSRIARKAPADEMLVMTTAPVEAVTPKPTSDATALSRAVGTLAVNDLGGNLSTAVRIGRAVMGAEPDEILVFTDEPAPAQLPAGRVRWTALGRPLANLALAGVDASGPLCSPADARVITTVQSFSDRPSAGTVRASQDGQMLAEARVEVAPRARATVSLELPAGVVGWVEVALAGAADHLAVDDRAWVELRQDAKLPIAVRSEHPAFVRTLSAWLQACPAASWAQRPPPAGGAHLLITDGSVGDPSTQAPVSAGRPSLGMSPAAGRGVVPSEVEGRRSGAQSSPRRLHEPAAAATMRFLPSAASAPAPSHWIAAADHPVAFYLSSVEVVTASLSGTADAAPSGTAVISALVGGRRVPVVVADEQDGGRRVTMLFDPAQSRQSTPVLVAFLNSLRWLMGQAQVGTTGEPLLASGFAAGQARLRRPDGTTETVSVEGGSVRYDATTRAGLYRITQRAMASEVAVNFFDPLESDLISRPSTWRPLDVGPLATDRPRRASYPLAPPLLGLLVALLVGEWVLYAMRGLASRAVDGGGPASGAARGAPRPAAALEPLESQR